VAGIRSDTVTAALSNDYPLATGALAFTGIFLLIAHFIADILYAVLDPRITYTGQSDV